MIHGHARLGIISPAVPGANHLAVFDDSLSERAALMQAHVIDGADLPPDIGNANYFSVAGKVARFVGVGQMGLGNDFDEGHSGFGEYRASLEREHGDWKLLNWILAQVHYR